MTAFYIAIAAITIDTLIGDPRSKLHPVVLIGNLISFVEKKLRNDTATPPRKRLAGAGLVFFVLFIIYGVICFVSSLASYYATWIAFAFTALLLSFTISPRSLAEAGIEIRNLLNNGDLIHARKKVGWIVGRDTEKLTVPEVTRATVETIAENIVDGIISPLFYFLIGGLPLAFLYRAVNTLDSMVGYKNEKYIDFGKAAARVDDIFNYIPSRITSLCILLAACLLRLNYKQAYRMVRRDARKHPSPNSGYSEACVAGALDIRLGGLNYYFGQPSYRAYMGDKGREMNPADITNTIYIMYTTIFIFFVFTAAICAL